MGSRKKFERGDVVVVTDGFEPRVAIVLDTWMSPLSGKEMIQFLLGTEIVHVESTGSWIFSSFEEADMVMEA